MQASMQTSRAASLAPVRSRVRRSAVRTCAAAAPVTWGNRSCHNGAHLSKERKAELEKVCEHIAQRGKGITACDEGEFAELLHSLALSSPQPPCRLPVAAPRSFSRISARMRPGPGTIGDRFAKVSSCGCDAAFRAGERLQLQRNA
jgi:hypothetical protein